MKRKTYVKRGEKTERESKKKERKKISKKGNGNFIEGERKKTE